MFVAIKPDETYNKIEHVPPITPKSPNAILKILCAALYSPSAIFSETSLDMAFGIPWDDINKSTV